jgi:predicted ATPase
MKLTEIFFRGYKSVSPKEGQTIPLGDVTILMGANGAGKSNLVSLLKMLNYMTTEALHLYVGKYGCSRLLHFGPKVCESIFFYLYFV